MELIEVYVYEVTRRLPEKGRDDIAMELQSTIEDMLPDHYSEEEVMEALQKLGDPSELAAKYRDTPNYLIGPKVFDAYMSVMKIAVPWVILLAILIPIFDSLQLFKGDEPLISVIATSFGMILASIISVLVQAFFWITLIFFIIDRNVSSKEKLSSYSGGRQKWTPEALKQIPIIPKRKAIKVSEVFFGVIWPIIWIIFYFNADRFAGVYRQLDGEGLRMVMPVFNHSVLLSYWPIVLLFAILQIGMAMYKFKERIWTQKLAITNTVFHICSILVMIYIVSNPSLINEAISPYMADILEFDISSIDNFINWAVWTVVVTIIVTTTIEVIDSFRKAKI